MILKQTRIGFLFIFVLFIQFRVFSQLNIDSLSHINYQVLHGANLNDVWGYVDELGNEYAIVGTSKGTSIVDVSNPSNPIEVFWLPGTESIWRDPCVYGDYAYVTTEAEDGLLIIDLSPLPQSTNLTTTLYTGPAASSWQSAHTCFIDENGFAYILGANRGNGGAIILDVQSNPMNPTEVGVFDNWYIHDGFARNDTLYAAHIYDGFFSLIDVSNKSNPVLLGTKVTPSSFTHNIWPSADGKYVYTTDEVSGAFIGVYDISDPTNIFEVDRTQNSPGLGVIPHNTHVKGDYLVTSYYSDGVVIHDITNPDNVIKIGQYDTYPGQTISFDGCWGVYPFLPSGTILAADITEGLFILGPNYQKASYLEGTVTDASTNNTLTDVSVQIVSNDQSELTNSNGLYKTGIFGTGTYNVTFQKVGYYPKTESIQLTQGQYANLSTQLIPIPPFNLDIQVYEAGGVVPISNAQIKLIHPLIEHAGVTNNIGQESITLFYQGGDIYNVQVGKWGYLTSCFDSVITGNTVSIIVELEKGYYDDFEFDFGWTSTGTAETGKWERGKPFGTSTGSQIEMDDVLDCGQYAYVTGNENVLNPDNDDVDNGTAMLISPQMDLTSYSDPHVNYSRGFYCFHGPFLVDDSLKITISNGTESAEIDFVTPPQSDQMSWERMSIPISGLIQITNTMQLFITTSDENPNVNITEAAFDKFSVTNYSLNELDVVESEFKIYPNPFNDELNIVHLKVGLNLDLFDQNGRILFQKTSAAPLETISLTYIKQGTYFLKIGSEIFKVIKV